MTTIRKNAWLLLFFVGLLLLAYAYYNIVFIPRLAPYDPEMGWVWLTTDPEVIDYIKWWFRTLGFWVLAVAVQTLIISGTGYRKGEKWAFYGLLILPAIIILHMFIWPWTIPVQIVLLFVIIAGFALPYRQFFPNEQAT